MITEKTHKCKESGRHAAMLEILGKVYEEGQVKLEKATAKSHETSFADSTDRGVLLRQYDPKFIRARSRFEGVSTPRNEWNRRLWTKTSIEETSRTSTSKRDEENQDITRVARTQTRGYMFSSYT